MWVRVVADVSVSDGLELLIELFSAERALDNLPIAHDDDDARSCHRECLCCRSLDHLPVAYYRILFRLMAGTARHAHVAYRTMDRGADTL